MFDREIGFTGKGPENAAQKPAAGEARVERQRSVDQPDHGTYVLAEMSQNKGRVGEDARVVLRHLERLPSEINQPRAQHRELPPPLGSHPRRQAHCQPIACESRTSARLNIVT
jgi:hypothetical protein